MIKAGLISESVLVSLRRCVFVLFYFKNGPLVKPETWGTYLGKEKMIYVYIFVLCLKLCVHTPDPPPHTQWQWRGQLPAPQVALGMWGIIAWDFAYIDIAKVKTTQGIT